MSATLQGFGMTIAVNCFFLETVLLILNITTSIYEAYVNWKNGIPREKTISSLWVRDHSTGTNSEELEGDIFDGGQEAKPPKKVNVM